MKLRRVVFWLHLIAGVFAGTIVFVMSVTGVALMYEKQMIEWADREFRVAPPSGGPVRLPVGTLLTNFREQHPEVLPTGITVYADPAAPAMVTAGPGQNLYLNPYTGEWLGEATGGLRPFFRFLTNLHRWLAFSNENRAIGRAVTGACNLAFFFIVCSGVYLWFPRTWTLQSLRQVTWFRRGLTGRSRHFNWHNTFGFWAALPLFFIVVSGVVMSYPWANNLVYRLTGSEAPTPNGPPNGADNRDRSQVFDIAGVDAAWNLAEPQVPGWRSINLRVPVVQNAPFVFGVDRGNGGQPQLRSTLTVDRKTREAVKFETFSDQNLGRQTRTWMRFLHTGEFYGVVGQTVAGIASAAAAMLVFTGLALALRRLRSWLPAHGSPSVVKFGRARTTSEESLLSRQRSDAGQPGV